MPRQKTSLLEILLYLLMLVFFSASTYLNWRGGERVGTLVLGGITVFVAAVLVGAARRGVRLATRWEYFKAWMYLRTVLVGVLGMWFLNSVPTYGESLWSVIPHVVAVPLLVILSLLWLVLMYYLIIRTRHRYESDAAYKRRVGYRERE